MTLDQLRYFAAVASYQHVGRAAASVAISPSVISSAVSALEEELGCELFQRRGRRIELTRQGEKLLSRSRAILASVEGLGADLRGEPESLVGKYRLGASHFLSSRLLLRGWMQLQAAHPKLVADLYSMNTAHAIGDVLTGKLDLALCFSPLTHPDLREHLIGEGELVVVVRKGHPALKKSPKDQVRFLAETSAVIHKSTQGVESCETHPIFGALGFQPKIAAQFDSDDIAIQSILSSERWSFVPDVVAKHYASEARVISLPRNAGKAPYRISALVHRERAQEAALQQLVKALEASSRVD